MERSLWSAVIIESFYVKEYAAGYGIPIVLVPVGLELWGQGEAPCPYGGSLGSFLGSADSPGQHYQLESDSAVICQGGSRKWCAWMP